MIAGVVVVVKAAGGSDSPPAASGEVVTPDHVTSSGAIPVGES